MESAHDAEELREKKRWGLIGVFKQTDKQTNKNLLN